MKSWQDALITSKTTIHETIRKIDETAAQIAVVIDADQKLLGTVTDGDIRRGILRGIAMDAFATEVMNKNPITVGSTDDRSAILALMKQRLLRRVPILDEDRRVIGIESIDELLQSKTKENWVVLMVGGLGTRLQHLTRDVPKPMLKVGGRPILETILLNFIEYGFKRFYFALNYKAEIIRNYFGDGGRWGIEIFYLYEERKLGTAGALSLLPEKPKHPVVVMNGDVLTKVNFDHLVDFHETHGSEATMCVREFDVKVPYGVLELDQHRIVSIREKPVHKHFVNAGIYVLEPSALARIPLNTNFDMPELFEKLLQSKRPPTAFPVREYWTDIGLPADFEKAQGDYESTE